MRSLLLLAALLPPTLHAAPKPDPHHLRRLESVLVEVAIEGEQPALSGSHLKGLLQRRLEQLGIEELMPSELEQNPTSPRYATLRLELATECQGRACAAGGNLGLVRPGLPADQIDRPGLTWALPTWECPLVVVGTEGELYQRLERGLESAMERFAASYYEIHPTKRVPDAALVKQIQEYLWLLGYDPGPRDGVAGPQTQGAIRAFQKGQELKEDGRTSEELLKRLRQVIQQRLKGE